MCEGDKMLVIATLPRYLYLCGEARNPAGSGYEPQEDARVDSCWILLDLGFLGSTVDIWSVVM